MHNGTGIQLPLHMFPKTRNYTNIQPFTVRDGVTYQLQIELLIAWLCNEVIPHLDSEVAGLVEEWKKNIEELSALFDDKIAGLDARVDEKLAAQVLVFDQKIAEVIALIDGANGRFDEKVTELEQLIASQNDYFNQIIQQIIDNSIELQDSVLAAILATPDSETAIFLENKLREYREKGMTVFNVKDFGAKGDGVTDDSPAINAALLAAQQAVDGGNVIIPAGKYFMNTRMNIFTGEDIKPVHVSAHGASFVKDGNFETVKASGVFETPYQVTNIATSRWDSNANNEIVETIILSLNVQAPAWKRGDIVKLVADDGLPNTQAGGTTASSQTRVGQHFTVLEVNGTLVTLAGEMIYNYTQNVRVARMKDAPFTWEGGTFDVTDAHISNGYEKHTFNLEGTCHASVKDVVIKRSTGAGVSNNGCFGSVFDRIYMGYGKNWPNGEHRAYGYGISDGSSQGTILTNSYFHQVRHAYTGGVQERPANDVIWRYGASYQAMISDCIADSCTSSGWDTHEGSRDVTFSNVTATNCTIGFGNRGVDINMFNIKTVNCDIGVRLFDAGGASRAYGHVIDGWVGINDTDGFEGYCGERSTADNYHVLETRETVIRNAQLRITRRGFKLHWARWLIQNVNIQYVGALNGPYPNLLDSGELTVNNLTLDYRYATSGMINAAWTARDVGRAPSAIIDGMFLRGAVSQRLGKILDHPTNFGCRAKNILMDQLPQSGVVNDAFTVGAYVDWEITGTGQGSSGYISLGQTDNIPSTSRRDVVVADFKLSANRMYGKLINPGRSGQMLVMVNNSVSANLTVQNGETYNTKLLGGVSKVLTPGQSVRLVSTPGNIWQEI